MILDGEMLFQEFPKIPRLSRECIITEKIDGTNASIIIVQSLQPEVGAVAHKSLGDAGNLSMFVGSRTRLIRPEDDNYGFARWVKEHAEELWALGPGRHYGEWWGQKIQRGYGLTEKRFSLFNVSKWKDTAHDWAAKYMHDESAVSCPPCCSVVPIISRGLFSTDSAERAIDALRQHGSVAAPGYMQPEGIIVYHVAGNLMFKKTVEKDEQPKGANR